MNYLIVSFQFSYTALSEKRLFVCEKVKLSLRETEKDFDPFGRFGCCTKAIQVYLKKTFCCEHYADALDISDV